MLLDIHEITTFTDYFVICNGTSERMLDALGSSLRDFIKKEFGISISIEGVARDGWVLLDVSDVMVHIFSPQQRDYYRLEQLWNKGKSLVTLQ